MNIKLKKTKLKSLTKTHNSISEGMTPQIAGGSSRPGGGGTYTPTQITHCDVNLCHSAQGEDMVCNITGTVRH
ncbi:hypothetical protein [Pseudoalteromonas luteoviolacea]|uniref:Uncharacterized protein n=1 Tax=Pseudoalteromonas luteoviolacea S4054 TaxID=1129367 RepID=A0A0F6AC47_9GAMM|nr:hypothetical protein [Pseudoalteromonas luteoviolacea]AOT06709.1 hypothetical protein S4054249_01895 [Pseudoalteromonas luteoviolacea]AOT11627.1 hypothetical protein S40542_01895 [Pseudoalteromonas luteoviolacea]AOT16539.1 hypothetical protein S4054_01895 [Pseudoalteromonas luteoviolacea]KKE83797.1 hypothetical protein N479_12455 [Pseudoalteromonas luteoviolacea S4054]KZN73920.1 hypothetical protein N481_10800 [Pseudoalteromonas luteoviolacea S4047-1]